MLSALELNGFKSFADRTRFEFPAGVTVVVGPNGSGKSNVVDAIKWVLGSQSIKALRGKEATDVIFNGSKSRRQANAAEASLVFDNSGGVLDIDAPEVQLTRRVYRSGESEYLINRQPCRLRDIRDLLSGIGMATGAYSIIEQGKVDAVLQATPKERRAIFEEAAGVSRFRTKREESLRRMERVQQHLLRLADIVDELDSRLKSVRAQAGKAQRYSELTRRLQELRTLTGRSDWQRLTRELSALDAQARAEQASVDSLMTESAACEAAVAEADAVVEHTQTELRELAATEAGLRERQAQTDATRSSHLVRIDELEQEAQRLTRQIETLSSRAGDSQQLVAETAAALAESEILLAGYQTNLAREQAALAAVEATATTIRDQIAEARTQLEQNTRRLALLVDEGQHGAAERLALEASLARSEADAAPLTVERERLAADAKRAHDELHRRAGDLSAAAESLRALQSSLADNRSRLTDAHRRVADTRGRLTGARERAEALEELERRLEGLTAGAKEVLRRARETPDGPFAAVQGVVADLLRVDADSAVLVEVALGERANYLVVADARTLAPVLAAESASWPGRTSFLRLDVAAPANAVDRIDLSNEPGVMGRADKFVDAEPELAGMVRRLLGRHWFVDSLGTALGLAAGAGRGLNFVTAAGETVLADGTMTVGPRQSMSGLLSRRSELRALAEQIAELERESVQAEALTQTLEDQIAAAASAADASAHRHAAAMDAHAEARMQSAAIGDKLTQADARAEGLVEERRAAARRLDQLRAASADADAECDALRKSNEDLVAQTGELELNLATIDERRAAGQQAVADLRVQLARNEQRVEGLRRQCVQLERDHAERDKALEETRLRAVECQSQEEQLRRAIEGLVAAKRQFESQLAEQSARLALVESASQQGRQQRTAAAVRSDASRQQLFQLQGGLQNLLLERQRFDQQRQTLAERLRDDYKIDVDQLMAPEEPAGFDRDAVEGEIHALREQLSATGSVNLEAVAELDSLESRHRGLAQQYNDLQAARSRLEQIIAHINGESRRLFTETVDEVRTHFQDIFRRLFAGGEADIVLEQDAGGDVLECGVSIIARPPGKQPRSISLLSGGERTLTCVALLLAIFRSRPSPFCVLDEVDAALDEANIDRFVEVLKQFMDSTQFIVITHSKRTMTCSDTLYGVTMQESGVSKRVSVRFEDVSEDGHIRPAALHRDDPPQARAA